MMMTLSLAVKGPAWSGACDGVQRRGVAGTGACARFDHTAGRDYWLYDECGRRLGTISAAAHQPTVGTNAPTFYLERILTP